MEPENTSLVSQADKEHLYRPEDYAEASALLGRIRQEENEAAILAELATLIGAYHRHKETAEAATRKAEEATQRADRDGLTGLLIKAAFEQKLTEKAAILRKYQKPSVILFIDADWFKEVNDSLGHKKGDELLQTLAKIIMLHTRPEDLAGRYGGDEIVVAIPGTIEVGIEVATRLQNSYQDVIAADRDYDRLDNKPSLSIGIYETKDYPPDMIHHADEAMYQSKQTKNSISVYNNPDRTITTLKKT